MNDLAPLADALLPLASESPRAHWAGQITESWRKSVLAIVETGRLLAQAREALAWGEWTAMIDADLPFGPRAAQMLIAIAEHPGIVALAQDANHGSLLPLSWRTLYAISRLDPEEFRAKIADGTINPDMMRADIEAPRVAEPMSDAEAGAGDAAGPKPVDEKVGQSDMFGEGDKPMPNAARAIAPSRQEPDDSLDFFPTPPWATRALIERVFPQLGCKGDVGKQSVWEPACGEGHMADVLREYFREVEFTDIHDYGYRANGADFTQADFFEFEDAGETDWIITNPPFAEKGEAFVLHALNLARVGVAMFFRLQWLETIGRYDDVFKPFPPALIAQFVERVPLHKGEYRPGGDTLTAYCWIVWLTGRETSHTRFFWIPPGCRESLTKADDVERFTQHPVRALPASAFVEAEVEAAPAKAWASPLADDGLEIPAFLKRHVFAEVSIDWKGAGPDNLGTDIALCSCGKELRVARGATPEENDVARAKLAAMMDEHKRAMGAA